MMRPDVTPTHIIHDDTADLHRAEVRLLHHLHWFGRMIAPDPDETGAPSCADCDACAGTRVFHGELCPQCT